MLYFCEKTIAHLSEDVSVSLMSLSEHSLTDPKQCQNPDLRLGTCEELEHQKKDACWQIHSQSGVLTAWLPSCSILSD